MTTKIVIVEGQQYSAPAEIDNERIREVLIGAGFPVAAAQISIGTITLRGQQYETVTFILPPARAARSAPAVIEKDVEDAVAWHLERQGILVERQVRCRAGKIDIVAGDTIYEIKLHLTREALFTAIGQVLIYRQAFNPTYRAVVIGLEDASAYIQDIIDYAYQLGVQIQLWRR